MRKADLRRSFFQYVFLNIISTLGVSIYILIDTFFISKGMGADGLTALNLCLPIFNFINGFGLMLGIGGGSKFSIKYGSVDKQETDKIFTNSFYIGLAVSAVFELIGLFFSRQFTTLLGADSSIFDLAHDYLRTILLFSPAFIMNHLLICFIRNDNAPKLAMAAVLTSSVVNTFLDYVFIFLLGMKMEGAALATSIAPLSSLCILATRLFGGGNSFRLRLTIPSQLIQKDILSLGLPSFVTEVCSGLVMIVFNFVVYRLIGNTGIAAYDIIANLAIVFAAIFTGLASGVQPLLCRVYGRKGVVEAKYLFFLSITMVIVLSAILYTLVFVFTSQLVSVFNLEQDAELKKIAEFGLRMYFTYLPFMGINTILSVYFTSIEIPLPSQLLALLRGAVLAIPLAFIFFLFKADKALWLTVPIAEVLTMILGIIIYYFIAKPYEVYVYRYVPKKKTATGIASGQPIPDIPSGPVIKL
ncbi:MAG: MATE family efflux transporter [Oscillospiraceae bacterium]|nr:MATE family efflux transporter [Oscillospiraceae bacterium]